MIIASLWKLRLTMLGTLALIISVTTLLFGALALYLGADLIVTAILIVTVNLAQWLFAPFIIDAIYGTMEADPYEYGYLYDILEDLSIKSGISTPKLMISSIPIPNAFAYGSPLTGNRVAITKGLLKILDKDEVAAVLGHELGHLKHKDVQLMMFVSLLPSLLFYLGYALSFSRSRENRGLLGVGLILVGYLLQFLVLGLSRLREYYADAHSAMINDARKLQSALAKIAVATGYLALKGHNITEHSQFRALFIYDPYASTRDMELLSDTERLITEIKSRKIGLFENIAELFSTHPNLVKRIKALDMFARR
ncbi:MAG: protease HtpX [Thermofilum sp. ex4484_82]|nr:MAG: protease HtpX [Thermofilum sp. ex4484_82]OYT37327.1 MAG: protease HtpX [Archaeoglobales archaeon ex4484_92]